MTALEEDFDEIGVTLAEGPEATIRKFCTDNDVNLHSTLLERGENEYEGEEWVAEQTDSTDELMLRPLADAKRKEEKKK
mgnify:CR=1 FL=1